MSNSRFDGVYWKNIETQTGGKKGQLQYEVSIVSASNNKPGSPKYDEDVPFISGSQFHVLNKTHGQERWFSFGSHVEEYIEGCEQLVKEGRVTP